MISSTLPKVDKSRLSPPQPHVSSAMISLTCQEGGGPEKGQHRRIVQWDGVASLRDALPIVLCVGE